MPLPFLFSLRQDIFGLVLLFRKSRTCSGQAFFALLPWRPVVLSFWQPRMGVRNTSFCTPSHLLLADGFPWPWCSVSSGTRRPSCALTGSKQFGLVHQLFPQFRNRENKKSILCLTSLGSCLLDRVGSVLREKKINKTKQKVILSHQRKSGLTSKKGKVKIYHSSPATIVRKKRIIKKNKFIIIFSSSWIMLK